MAEDRDATLPAAIPLECPVCEEETSHEVLKGTIGLRGQYTLDAVVRCAQCATTRHVLHREAAEREVPIIVSAGGESRRTTILLGEDEEVAVGDEILVDDVNVMLTGIEVKSAARRVEAAPVSDVATIWAKEYEHVPVRFAVNLGKKTISKVEEAQPGDVYTVGEERTFGRLRVTIHAIKTATRLHRRGAVEAEEIRRIFARPTREEQYSRPRRTPNREEREKRAAGEERRRRGGSGGAKRPATGGKRPSGAKRPGGGKRPRR